MATCAATNHGGMVNSSDSIEHQCVMTGATLIECIDVSRVFSFCGDCVMAGFTATNNATMFKTSRGHGNCCVAVVTCDAALNMIGGLSRCYCAVVATKAMTRSPLEEPLSMTGGAFNNLMSAGKYITGCEMIKAACSVCLQMELRHNKQHQQRE